MRSGLPIRPCSVLPSAELHRRLPFCGSPRKWHSPRETNPRSTQRTILKEISTTPLAVARKVTHLPAYLQATLSALEGFEGQRFPRLESLRDHVAFQLLRGPESMLLDLADGVAIRTASCEVPPHLPVRTNRPGSAARTLEMPSRARTELRVRPGQPTVRDRRMSRYRRTNGSQAARSARGSNPSRSTSRYRWATL